MSTSPLKVDKRILAVFWLASAFSLAAQEASYVGGAACTGCHREVAERYSQTPMARSFGAILSAADAPELKGAQFFHETSQQDFRFEASEGQPKLIRTAQPGLQYEARVDYWFGSGNHARSYLSRTARGELVELPVSRYSEGDGTWAMSPGYDRPDHAGFSRKVSARCMFCHNANLESAFEEDELRFPAALPAGIDCERCHGPGSLHAAAATSGATSERLRASIVNPARLPPDRAMDVCLQCHLETTSLRLPASLLAPGRDVFSYRPGESLSDYVVHFDRADQAPEERFEFASSGYRLLQSRCYEASDGALTCATCHSPHGESRSATQACLDCHNSTIAQQASQGAHPTEQNCIACHMPKRRAADAIHVEVADHAIVRAFLPETNEVPIEKHDGNTQPYRGEVALFYSKSASSGTERLLFAMAQVKHDANLSAGLRNLATAVADFAPTEPEAYLELAEGLRRAGRLKEALPAYEQAGARAPRNWRVLLRWGTALVESGDAQRGAPILERARLAAPDQPAVLEAIADLLAAYDQPGQATEMLREAVRLDPLSAGVRGKLGAQLYQAGNVEEAEREWSEAVRLRPEAASHRLNLANLLTARDALAAAVPHFEASVRSAPEFADARLAYGTALAAAGRWEQAREQLAEGVVLAPRDAAVQNELGRVLLELRELEGAIEHLQQATVLSPESASAHVNLGTAFLSANRLAQAEQSFRLALRTDPSQSTARLHLGLLLAARGDAQAAEHLRHAAQSNDASIRERAESALEFLPN